MKGTYVPTAFCSGHSRKSHRVTSSAPGPGRDDGGSRGPRPTRGSRGGHGAHSHPGLHTSRHGCPGALCREQGGCTPPHPMPGPAAHPLARDHPRGVGLGSGRLSRGTVPPPPACPRPLGWGSGDRPADRSPAEALPPRGTGGGHLREGAAGRHGSHSHCLNPPSVLKTRSRGRGRQHGALHRPRQRSGSQVRAPAAPTGRAGPRANQVQTPLVEGSFMASAAPAGGGTRPRG